VAGRVVRWRVAAGASSLCVLRGIRAGEQGKPSEGLAGEQVDQPYQHDPHAASERLSLPDVWQIRTSRSAQVT
jgi:hypothetical protein